jgi:hypothetical protein
MLFVKLNKYCAIFSAGAIALCLLAPSVGLGAAWEDRISPGGPGDFPPLPTPFRATYRIGWGGMTAARADLVINRNNSGLYEFRADTATIGAARTLWSFDAVVRSTVSAPQLRPIRIEQTEERSDRTLRETVRFDATGAERIKSVVPKAGNVEAKSETKRFESGALQDFMSAFLNLRSQPLANGDTRTVVVMSPSVPYLMTVTARNREEINTRAGRFRAIRISVDSIQRVKGDGTLVPHKRFRSATVWLSDDATRQILRVQSQVFIGAVFLELDSPPQVANGR